MREAYRLKSYGLNCNKISTERRIHLQATIIYAHYSPLLITDTIVPHGKEQNGPMDGHRTRQTDTETYELTERDKGMS